MTVDDLDAAGVLAEAGHTVYERRAAEVYDLRLLTRWAVLHGTDPHKDPGASPFDALVPVGGDGTPWVRDMCLAEIAVVRQVHELSVRSALADALDLQHRLPRVWALVERLEAEPWLARRAASMSRRVPLEHMGVVDSAVAAVIGGEAPSRVLELVAAKVIEADPEAHARRVEEQRRRRFVVTGRIDECGLRHLIARVTAGDAVALEAMVDRVARVLADQHARDADGDLSRVPGLDELRSDALGLLARPAEALQLLLTHALEHEQDAAHPLRSSRTTAFPQDLLEVLRSCDPARLGPQLTIYAHLSADALAAPERAVARVEGIGPVLASQLRSILGECAVTLKPVIDLAEAVRGTAYRADGGPGQTGTHNSQPLSRRSHRRKTHAGFRTSRMGPGRYLWRTPHGHYLVVGPNGTFPISPEEGRAIERPVPVQFVYSLAT